MSSKDTKRDTSVTSDLGKNSSAVFRGVEPVHDAKALKAAVLNTIDRMPENGNTHEYCLYILRALNDPDMICQDIEYMERKAMMLRNKRETSLRVKGYMVATMGMLISVACSAIVGWAVSRIP